MSQKRSFNFPNIEQETMLFIAHGEENDLFHEVKRSVDEYKMMVATPNDDSTCLLL